MAQLRVWADANASLVVGGLGYPDPLATAVRSMLVEAQGDPQVVKKSLGDWYDGQMASTSRLYRQHMRSISVGIALVLVLVFNINAIRIADSLYSQAMQASCGARQSAACLHAHAGLFHVTGWGAFPGNLGALVLVPLGWALMVALLTPGADFWLNQLSRLRGFGSSG